MNVLPAKVVRVRREAGLALVEAEACGAHRLTAMLIGDPAGALEGRAVRLVFKETEVALAKNLSGLISLRNRHPARVTAIEYGELLARVRLDFAGAALAAVITAESARRLQLAVGDSVEWLVKANEMGVEMGVEIGA